MSLGRRRRSVARGRRGLCRRLYWRLRAGSKALFGVAIHKETDAIRISLAVVCQMVGVAVRWFGLFILSNRWLKDGGGVYGGQVVRT